MNDFDYDVLQKKRIARGAYARKSTTNRKGCTLPHELLTKKELEKMNGEITTINLNAKVSWERFKTWAPTVQAEYLNHQLRRFGVGLAVIGRDMFGLSDTALAHYVRDKGLAVEVKRGGKIPKAAYDSWKRWLNSDQIAAPASENTETPQATEEKDFLPNTGTANKIKAPVPDLKDLFREAGLERAEAQKADDPDGNPYPLKDLGMTLMGTPIDILATLRMSFPALLDKDKVYRFQIKVDDFVL
jgi:hypothetical protein